MSASKRRELDYGEDAGRVLKLAKSHVAIVVVGVQGCGGGVKGVMELCRSQSVLTFYIGSLCYSSL